MTRVNMLVVEDGISGTRPCAVFVYLGWITYCCQQEHRKTCMESQRRFLIADVLVFCRFFCAVYYKISIHKHKHKRATMGIGLRPLCLHLTL